MVLAHLVGLLDVIIKDAVNDVSACRLPREAEGEWPWRAPRRTFATAWAAYSVQNDVSRGQGDMHCVQGVFIMAPGRSKSKQKWAQDEVENGR